MPLEENAAPPSRYPALARCIGEARPAEPREVRRVAGRLWLEGLRHHGNADATLSFARRRALIRAARAILDGHAAGSQA